MGNAFEMGLIIGANEDAVIQGPSGGGNGNVILRNEVTPGCLVKYRFL